MGIVCNCGFKDNGFDTGTRIKGFGVTGLRCSSCNDPLGMIDLDGIYVGDYDEPVGLIHFLQLIVPLQCKSCGNIMESIRFICERRLQ